MFLLPRHLQRLFERKKKEAGRAFDLEVDAPEALIPQVPTVEQVTSQSQAGQEQTGVPVNAEQFEIYPADPFVRKIWFDLTIREREVVALVCMGYRNYEIASILGIGIQTVWTHLQHIFDKFDLQGEMRNRKEIRARLSGWPAEEWWARHH